MPLVSEPVDSAEWVFWWHLAVKVESEVDKIMLWRKNVVAWIGFDVKFKAKSHEISTQVCTKTRVRLIEFTEEWMSRIVEKSPGQVANVLAWNDYGPEEVQTNCGVIKAGKLIEYGVQGGTDCASIVAGCKYGGYLQLIGQDE